MRSENISSQYRNRPASQSDIAKTENESSYIRIIIHDFSNNAYRLIEMRAYQRVGFMLKFNHEIKTLTGHHNP